MGYRRNPVSPEELRRLAKMRLLGHQSGAVTDVTLPEVQQLFEELEIHQIELELQNEHLSTARAQLELALNQSSELYDFSPVGSLLLDPTGAISKLNLAAANLLGGERSRLLGRRLGLYVSDAERPVFNALLERARITGDEQGSEISLTKKGMVATPVQIRIAPLPEDLGWQVNILVDITDRRQMEERLRVSEERLTLALDDKKKAQEALLGAAQFQQAVFDSLAAHIAVLDRQGNIIQTNAAWRKYALDNAGLDAVCFAGVNYLEILECMTGKDQETVRAASAGIAAVASGKLPRFQLAQPFYAPPDQRWFTMRVTPMQDVQQRVVVSHEDVSHLKAAELASWTLANVDAPTGALSRRNFMNLAELELARSTRYELPLTLLMLDLDHFKRLNDNHGHAAGDAVLQGFVNTVTAVLRESDLIGRLGGEEFAVLLPNTGLEGGRALAQRIIDSVRSNPIQVSGERIAYTVSIGAGCLSSQTSFAGLLGLADGALYQAKNGGRDRLEVGAG